MEPWTRRTVIRATLAGSMSLLTALVGVTLDGSISLNEALYAVLAGVTMFSGWLGVGSVSSNVEPFLNNDRPGSVSVPVPPATRDPNP